MEERETHARATEEELAQRGNALREQEGRLAREAEALRRNHVQHELGEAAFALLVQGIEQVEDTFQGREQELEAAQGRLLEGKQHLVQSLQQLETDQLMLREQSADLQREAERLDAEQQRLDALREELARTERALAEQTPPEAHKQALETSRKELRELRQELDEVYQELSTAAEQWQSAEQRLLSQRSALIQVQSVINSSRLAGPDLYRVAGEAAARVLDLSRFSVWQADEHFSRMHCTWVAPMDPAHPYMQAELRRDDVAVLFMALESDPVLAVRDVMTDPRTRPAALLAANGCRSALFTTVIEAETVKAILLFESAGQERVWQRDEENFVQVLGQLLSVYAGAAIPAAPPALKATVLDDLGESPQYRFMVESMGGIIWALNREGQITFVNPAAEQAYGLSAQVMLGQPIAAFANGDAGHADLEAMRNVLDGLPSCAYENTHVRSDGSPLRLHINMAVLQDEAGEVMGTVVAASEISEASLSGAAAGPVRNAPAEFSEVVWAVDMAGRITYVNEAVQAVYGYQPAEMLGQSIMMLSDDKQARLDLARLNEALADKACYGYVVTHKRKDGGPVELLILGEVQRDPEGRATGVKGLAIDLTRRRLKVKTRW
ncbi:MAG: PAS domain S-box protein [Candidatus Hydrogenedentes bacterium]|nr:PAS domain S-box protein [Candidatus Hydrogenedentota bacterium]